MSKVVNEEESPELRQLNEMLVHVEPSLPAAIENSVYYARLKFALYPEILGFCREKTELRDDLNLLRLNVGVPMGEQSIRDYMDSMMGYYNGRQDNVGVAYHLEITRVDYGLAVFVVIKRDDCYMKKFVYRFRKNLGEGLAGLSNSGVPVSQAGPSKADSDYSGMMLDREKEFKEATAEKPKTSNQ
jgi:hypothetical protein